MSLKINKQNLEKAILKAFERAFTTGKNADKNDDSEKIRKDLATDLTNAINEFILSADVNISLIKSTVPPGIIVSAPPPAGAGTTISPGIVEHVGYGKLQ